MKLKKKKIFFLKVASCVVLLIIPAKKRLSLWLTEVTKSWLQSKKQEPPGKQAKVWAEGVSFTPGSPGATGLGWGWGGVGEAEGKTHTQINTFLN